MPVPVKLRELERSLNNVYLKIYREIKKDANYPNNVGILQLKFNKLVYDNTRSAVQQAVILGNERVNRLSKTEPYLTQQDLNLIKKNAQEQTDSFWRKIHLDVFRKQEQQALVGGAEFDEDFFLEQPLVLICVLRGRPSMPDTTDHLSPASFSIRSFYSRSTRF